MLFYNRLYTRKSTREFASIAGNRTVGKKRGEKARREKRKRQFVYERKFFQLAMRMKLRFSSSSITLRISSFSFFFLFVVTRS